MYYIPNPSLLFHIQDKLTRNGFLILIQEIKSDIFYVNPYEPASLHKTSTNPQRFIAHLDSAFTRPLSYFHTLGLGKFAMQSWLFKSYKNLVLTVSD